MISLIIGLIILSFGFAAMLGDWKSGFAGVFIIVIIIGIIISIGYFGI